MRSSKPRIITILALGVLPLQPAILQIKNASPPQGLTAGTAENEKMARKIGLAGGLPESAASDPLAPCISRLWETK
jgi:hypothetical protein